MSTAQRSFRCVTYALAVSALVLAACAPQAPAGPTAAPPRPTALPTGVPVNLGSTAQPAATVAPATAPAAPPAPATKAAVPQVTIVYPIEFESRSPYGQSGQQGNAFWQHVYDPLLTFDDTTLGHVRSVWLSPA
jgi:ABC-type transport system substrate-binding protein